MATAIDNGDGSATAMCGTSSGSYSYLWDNGQSSATVTGLQNGSSYCVSVTDANNCVDTACVNIAIIALQHVEEQAALQVFPNPSAGEVQLRWEGARSGTARLEVFDMRGRKYREMNGLATQQQMTIDCGELPAGLYQFRLTLAERVFVRQVIIQK